MGSFYFIFFYLPQKKLKNVRFIKISNFVNTGFRMTRKLCLVKDLCTFVHSAEVNNSL